MKKKQSFYYFYGKKNLLKIMRLLFILMTMTSMTISANGFSQEQRVTLDVKNVGAMELFKQIQKETEQAGIRLKEYLKVKGVYAALPAGYRIKTSMLSRFPQFYFKSYGAYKSVT